MAFSTLKRQSSAAVEVFVPDAADGPEDGEGGLERTMQAARDAQDAVRPTPGTHDTGTFLFLATYHYSVPKLFRRVSKIVTKREVRPIYRTASRSKFNIFTL